MTVTAPPALWGQHGTYPASADRGLLNALWPGEGAGGLRREGLDTSVVPGTRDLRVSPGRVAMPMRVFDGTSWVLTGGTLLCASDGSEIVHVPPPPPSFTQLRAIFVVPHGQGIDAQPAGWELQVVNGPAALVGTPPWVDYADYPPNAYPIAWFDDNGAPTLDGAQLTVNAGLGDLQIGAGDLAGDVTGPADDNRVVGLQGRRVGPVNGTEADQPLLWVPGQGWLPQPVVKAIFAGQGITIDAHNPFVTISLSTVGGSIFATWAYATAPMWGIDPNNTQTVLALYGLSGGAWVVGATMTWQFDVQNGAFCAIRHDGGSIVNGRCDAMTGAMQNRLHHLNLNALTGQASDWNCYLTQMRMSSQVGGWVTIPIEANSGAPACTLTAVRVG